MKFVSQIWSEILTGNKIENYKEFVKVDFFEFFTKF